MPCRVVWQLLSISINLGRGGSTSITGHTFPHGLLSLSYLYILPHSQLVAMVIMGYRLGLDKDLALRGLLAPWGGSDMDLAHGGFWPSGEDSVLALGGWRSGEAHCQYSLA